MDQLGGSSLYTFYQFNIFRQVCIPHLDAISVYGLVSSGDMLADRQTNKHTNRRVRHNTDFVLRDEVQELVATGVALCDAD